MYTGAIVPPLSIIFCGTPEFAVPSLEELLRHPETFSIRLVITQPDQPVGRKQELTPPPVKLFGEAHRLPLIQPEDINDPTVNDQLSTINCDLLVTVAYGQILSPTLLALPRLGAVNVHPSLLSRWRGASPIQNTLLAGDTETGVTIQQMSAELDAGPILAQEVVAITPEDTFESLSRSLAVKGAQLLAATLTKPFAPVPQDPTKVTVCRKLTRKDGEVNPSEMSAEEIHRRVRSLTPWPGVTAPFGGMRVKLLLTALIAEPEALEVPCADGRTLYVLNLQPPGRKPMTGKAWLRGHSKP